jgi:hypothetical protein
MYLVKEKHPATAEENLLGFLEIRFSSASKIWFTELALYIKARSP